MEFILVSFLAGLLVGALMGIAPLILGRFLGRKMLGLLGLLCSAFGGALLGAVAAILIAVGFSIVILAARSDVSAGFSAAGNHTAQIMCMTGPLHGQVYTITSAGLLIGRDPCCGLRMPGNVSAVSRRHCNLLLQGGKVYLEDLQSSYGTYLASGQRLVPNRPVELTNGSRFYLGSSQNQFQLTV